MKIRSLARIFSIFVIFSMLFSVLGMPNQVARATTTVTLESSPTIFTGNSSTSSPYTVSWSHTTGTGADRLLLVGVSWNPNANNSPITSVTFTYGGGTVLNLSEAVSRKSSWLYRFAAIWYSPTEPPSGQAGTVKVTFAAQVASGVVAGSANFAGVDTVTPIGPTSSADAVSSTISNTVQGLTGNELVFDNLFVGGTSTTVVVDPSQTQLTGWNAFISPARGAASTEDANSNSSVEMSWTPTAAYVWVDVAAALNPNCSTVRYSVSAGSTGHGTVAINPSGSPVCSGRTATLTPVPDSGYLFSGWVGTNAIDISADPPYTIVMDEDKLVTANFVPQSCQDASPINVDDDTYISGATGAGSFNYGGAPTLQVDRGTGTSRRSALLRWSTFSSIPSDAVINSASIQLQVTDTSTIAYPLYDVAKPWVEGSNNGAAGTGASWTYYDAGSTAWLTAGASSITGAVDRGNTNLWSSATGSFGTAGASSVSLNSDGLSVLRRWIAGDNNNGVIIQDYTSTTNTLAFDGTGEGTVPAKLNINYCTPNNTAPNDPTLDSPTPSGVTGISTSPTLEVFVSDPDGGALDITFYGREVGAGSWTNLGTDYGYGSASNASMLWSGLDGSTQYEWYVTVYDGAATTTGSTWNFTTISSDTTAPVVTSFTATSPINSLTIPITSFTASDAVGVTGYMITENSTQPASGDASWAVTAPTSHVVAAEGYYSLYPWAKDAAGNVSAVYGSPANVVVDTTAPAVTAFVATNPSTSLDIPITTFTAADATGGTRIATSGGSGVAGYLVTETSTQPSAGDAWAGSVPTTYSVASDGNYTLYPWVKDAAGNVSSVYGDPESVLVDTTPPDTQIDSNPPDPSQNVNERFTFSSPDDASATFECSLDSGSYEICSTPYKLPTALSEGSHEFEVRAKDSLGNVDQSPASYSWDVNPGNHGLAIIYRGGAWMNYDFATTDYLGGTWTGKPATNCIPAYGDYDGDGDKEYSQLCEGAWHFYNDNGSYNKGIWIGDIAGQLPVPGDYDGDDTDEVVVYRAGAWLFYDFATAAYVSGVWTGAPEYSGTPVPAPMDYDGDGKLEFTVFSNGPWHFYNDDGSYNKGIWTGGVAGDKAVPGDYNGDGADEVVIFREGAWMFFDIISGEYESGIWTGAPVWTGTPLPAPLDIDDDGSLEFTVFSNGPWHFYNDDGSYNKGIWTGGLAGDTAISHRLLP